MFCHRKQHNIIAHVSLVNESESGLYKRVSMWLRCVAPAGDYETKHTLINPSNSPFGPFILHLAPPLIP